MATRLGLFGIPFPAIAGEVRQLVGSSAGQAVASATLIGVWRLTGASAGVATVTGVLIVDELDERDLWESSAQMQVILDQQAQMQMISDQRAYMPQVLSGNVER